MDDGGTAPARRGRGRPVAGDSRATKEAIMDAALEAFGHAGYADVLMGSVAAACGVDQRTISYHFGSKRGLYEAVRVRAFGRFVDEFRARLVDGQTARKRLLAYLDVYRHLHATDPHILPFIGLAVLEGVSSMDNVDSLLEAAGELFGMLSSVVEDGVASGEVNPKVDQLATVQMVSALSIGMSIMSISPGPYPETLDALELLINGLLFTEPG